MVGQRKSRQGGIHVSQGFRSIQGGIHIISPGREAFILARNFWALSRLAALRAPTNINVLIVCSNCTNESNCTIRPEVKSQALEHVSETRSCDWFGEDAKSH